MKEQTASYDPLVGLTLDIDPGEYVLLTKEDWGKVKKYSEGAALGEKPKVTVMELSVPDPGPEKCPECGISMWTHSSSCSKLK